MKKSVLIKYSLIVISILLFSNCKKKADLQINSQSLKYKVENEFIVKGNDSIFLIRKHTEDSSQVDSVILNINNKKLLIKIPMITYYSLDLKTNVPNDKRYDFGNNDFLINATYRDFIIQYQFDYKLYMLKNIYMITNIDEVYPDFNKKATDSIAKIEIVNVYSSKNLEKYLNQFTDSVYNDKVKVSKTHYILRKERYQSVY